VHSTVTSFVARNEIRKSWLRFNTSETNGIKVLFLVGMAHPFVQNSIMEKLQNESKKFQDVIQVIIGNHFALIVILKR